MKSRAYYVYIMANRREGTLYIGMTNDLVRRIHEHKTGAVPGFSQKYNTKLLVYYEQTDNVEAAITREKQMKKWYRNWKLELIEAFNPDWRDLYDDIVK